MYEEYFGLNRSPFKITPDTSLFFDGGRRGDILGALVYAVHRGEGIIKVVGEVGSGKTMLCRMLQVELPDNVEMVYIANPNVSAEDILFVIASELKLEMPRDSSKHELVSALQHYLLEHHAENRQVVLFVEEAQGMPIETLEEIRLLSNLETDEHKLLQIVLFGQPELDDNLSQKSIRQLRERITHDFNLAPLGADEIHQYLNFRMREVGYTGPELINANLARQIARHSEGLLRRINILADKMLLAAFADGTHTLSSKHLMAAVEDSGFITLHDEKQRTWRWLGLFLLSLLLLFAAAYAYLQSDSRWSPFAMKSWISMIGEDHEQAANPALQDSSPADTAMLTPQPGDESRAVVNKEKANRKQEAAKTPTTEVVIAEAEPNSITRPLQEARVAVESEETAIGSKKTQQSDVIIDKVTENQPLELQSSSKSVKNKRHWLDNKLASSKAWLKSADAQGVSIQVMMRSKAASDELAEYLLNEWPLELDKTYVYEVQMKGKSIYRVFYDEFPTLSLGNSKIKQLPRSVRVNSPYLHSIYRMQQALL